MMSDTARTALIGGVLALLGAIGGATVTGWSQAALARQKFHADLVLKALESHSPEERLESLKLLVETKLLNDTEIQKAVMEYAKRKESSPSTIPQVASSAKFEAPVIPNSRIYLLAGGKSKELLFPLYKQQLEAAGFRVLGAKTIVDPGRPPSEEVRFFHEEDRAQAQKIAEVVRFQLSVPDLPARLYSDKSANPGYIEIWFAGGP
jgi:hypothetical protein